MPMTGLSVVGLFRPPACSRRPPDGSRERSSRPPILDDLLRFGKVDRPPRPWLGLFATDAAEGVAVTGLAAGGPAAKAGIAAGDVVVALDGQEIEDLGDLWQKLWAAGDAGVAVAIQLMRDGRELERTCRTADRASFLRRPALH